MQAPGGRINLGDPLSSRDTAISYGYSGDYNSREGYYNLWGLDGRYGAFRGTGEQGEALRREGNEQTVEWMIVGTIG